MRILRSQYMQLRNRPTTTTSKTIADFDDESSNDDVNVHNKTQEMSIHHHLQTIDCSQGLSPSAAMGSSIKIHFDRIDESVKNLNVIVEFTDMDAWWLTNLFKSYENDLWHRSERFCTEKKNKRITYWFYHCGLCKNVYKQFSSIKAHLNLHLKFFPYVCKACGMKYTNRKAATVHLKNRHKLQKDLWNEYLTS